MNNKIAVVLCGTEKENTLKKVFPDVGWIEVRIDRFLLSFPETKLVPYLTKIRKGFKGKIIGTIRGYREQTEKKIYIKENKRKEIYEKIMPFIDYIDIELQSKVTPEMNKIAKHKNKKTIISYHNFQKTPSDKELDKLYKKAGRLKPDIFKVAVKINKPSDFLTLLNTFKKGKMQILTVPMGSHGILRFIPVYMGSPFTYVFLEKQTAPGQISYETFRKISKFLI